MPSTYLTQGGLFIKPDSLYKNKLGRTKIVYKSATLMLLLAYKLFKDIFKKEY